LACSSQQNRNPCKDKYYLLNFFHTFFLNFRKIRINVIAKAKIDRSIKNGSVIIGVLISMLTVPVIIFFLLNLNFVKLNKTV
jgi:hypothetical protein